MKSLIVLCVMVYISAAFPDGEYYQEPEVRYEQEEPEPEVRYKQEEPEVRYEQEEPTEPEVRYKQDEPTESKVGYEQEEPELLDSAMYSEDAQMAASVRLPHQVKSINAYPKLTLYVTNNRNTLVRMYWVNYSGVLKPWRTIYPKKTIIQRAYGTHPWLLTSIFYKPIAMVIPYAVNTRVTVEERASWY